MGDAPSHPSTAAPLVAGFTCDLIVPARDEVANMPAFFAALQPLIEAGVLRRIVVADNGSTDATAQLARQYGAEVVHEPRPGYGAACLAAIAHLTTQPDVPQAVAFLDADLADDPEKLPALIAAVAANTADLVIASRRRLAQPGALTFTQRFGNRLACAMLRAFAGHHYEDLGPMRVIRWSSLRQLAMADRTWGWTVEMQFKAVRHDLRIVEIDTPYRRRHAGRSKISGSLAGSAKAGWKIIITILALWWRQTPPQRDRVAPPHQ